MATRAPGARHLLQARRADRADLRRATGFPPARPRSRPRCRRFAVGRSHGLERPREHERVALLAHDLDRHDRTAPSGTAPPVAIAIACRARARSAPGGRPLSEGDGERLRAFRCPHPHSRPSQTPKTAADRRRHVRGPRACAGRIGERHSLAPQRASVGEHGFHGRRERQELPTSPAEYLQRHRPTDEVRGQDDREHPGSRVLLDSGERHDPYRVLGNEPRYCRRAGARRTAQASRDRATPSAAASSSRRRRAPRAGRSPRPPTIRARSASARCSETSFSAAGPETPAAESSQAEP